jgi:hypothetical protein
LSIFYNQNIGSLNLELENCFFLISSRRENSCFAKFLQIKEAKKYFESSERVKVL